MPHWTPVEWAGRQRGLARSALPCGGSMAQPTVCLAAQLSPGLRVLWCTILEAYLHILAVSPAAGCVGVQASMLSGLCGGRAPPRSCRRARHLIRAQATEAQRPPSLSSLRKLEGWELREEQRAETTQTLLIVFPAGQTLQCTHVGWAGLAQPFHFQVRRLRQQLQR